MPTTFISYRRDDAAGYAGRLHEALENRLGSDQVFRDIDTLEPGQDFVETIEMRLTECRVLLAMIGREWLDSRDASGQRRLEQPHDYVRLEIARALARLDVRVIPVLIEGASMPAASTLPDDLRALARKQAVHLRDDAWDHDVDRLASVISEVCATPVLAARVAPAPSVLSKRWVPLAVGILVLATLVRVLMPRENRDGTTDADAGVAAARDSGSANRPASSTSTPRGEPYGVVIPRVSEVAHRALIYTILSARVVPLGNGTGELRVRVRFSNEGRYDANAWDASFRLAAGGNVLSATSGLNEIAPGHSLTQGIVTFTIPADTGKAVLRVIEADRVAEIPLDLSVTTRPAEDEKADAGDALSRAIVRNVAGTPRQLVADSAMNVTVERGTVRRFANVVRLRFGLRFRNAGRYPAGSGDAVLRMAAGDQVIAPIEAPILVIEPNAESIGNAEFEVPSSTSRVVLRATLRDANGEWPLELQ
jgi:hypothetical protein